MFLEQGNMINNSNTNTSGNLIKQLEIEAIQNGDFFTTETRYLNRYLRVVRQTRGGGFQFTAGIPLALISIAYTHTNSLWIPEGTQTWLIEISHSR